MATPQVLLALVILIVVTCHLLWLRLDALPPRWDDSHYLDMGLRLHDALAHPGRAFAHDLVALDRGRPPLVPLLSSVFYIFGRSPDAALLLFSVGLVVLALTVYAIGSRLMNRWCGLIAAIIVCGSPSLIGLSRIFYLDFGDTVLVAAALYFVIRTDGFRRRGSSVALGVLIGMGLLSRAFFPIFVLGAIGGAVIAGVHPLRIVGAAERKAGYRRVVANIAITTFVAVGLASPWYIVNGAALLRHSFGNAYGAGAKGYGPAHPLSISALTSFFVTYLDVHLTIIGLSALVLGMLAIRTHGSRATSEGPAARRCQLLTLASAVVIPYLFFSALVAQDSKNLAPTLPSVAVLSSYGLLSLRSMRVRTAVVSLTVAWFAFQFAVGTFGTGPLPDRLAIGLGTSHPLLHVSAERSGPKRDLWPRVKTPDAPGLPDLILWRDDSRASTVSWPLDEVVRDLSARARASFPAQKGAVVVGVVPSHAFFNLGNLQYAADLSDRRLEFRRIGAQNVSERAAVSQLRSFEIVIVKTGDPGLARSNPYTRRITGLLLSQRATFQRMGRAIALPDGSEALILIRGQQQS